MGKYVLNFYEIDKTDLPYVGGKGANLGELTKAGFSVPQGFCVTTFAYRTFIQNSKEMDKFFEQLDWVSHNNLEQIRLLGQQIREHLTSLTIPATIKSAIVKAWETTGNDKAYAVRSSATAEDLPTASFAGQQDTYLNVCGVEQLLIAVQNCWASLFTDRAISYRPKTDLTIAQCFYRLSFSKWFFQKYRGLCLLQIPSQDIVIQFPSMQVSG
ncbi:hypothetical protein NDK43_10110 [Neobacillus pocheonensis]|uniref:Phosphoenolpyruvate synthase n=1 Tax=Neobacillus pocheonensis TaxID=363869 RepID=A0ABT0WAX9_9BACI|nr:hypothetical protein [Neobacillus pocheonensis]